MGMGWALLGSWVARAEPVLVPDFTPATTSEFGIASMLQDEVVRALTARGYLVIDEATASLAGAGPSLAGCADRVDCPTSALPSLPARFAVVVRIARLGPEIIAEVQVYQTGFGDPVESWEIVVQSGKEGAFAGGVVAFVDGRAELLGPAPPDLTARAQALLAPVGPDEPADESGGSRFVRGSAHQVEASGLSSSDWIRMARPHADRWVVEIRGGLRAGDTVREADVQVGLDDTLDVTSTWFQEGPSPGVAPAIGLGLGVAPWTFLDAVVTADAVFGRREVRTSWSLAGVPQEVGQADGLGVALAMQPKLRLYAPPAGVAKAMVIAGADLLWFDGYHVEVEGLDYPEPPGGLVAGPCGGLGVVVDPSSAIGMVIEVVGVKHLGLRAGAAEDGVRVGPRPPPPDALGASVSATVSVQLRPAL